MNEFYLTEVKIDNDSYTLKIKKKKAFSKYTIDFVFFLFVFIFRLEIRKE